MAQNSSEKTSWPIAAQIVVGMVLGLALSVIGVTLFLLSSVVLAALFVSRMRRFGWRRDAVTALTVCLVLIVCYLLPTKQLDVKVGPMVYEDVPLSELCERLRVDHGIICWLPDRPGDAYRVSFSTDKPLSRREILEKLSRETNRRLHIGYCGSSATILFGAYPSFTYLEPKAESIRDDDSRQP